MILNNLCQTDHVLSTGGNFRETLDLCEQSGITFLNDLRSCNFLHGIEWEVKLLTIKCKLLTSKRIDLPREKIAREFELTSQKLKILGSQAANFSLINQELP